MILLQLLMEVIMARKSGRAALILSPENRVTIKELAVSRAGAVREAANSLIVILCSGDRTNAARPDFLAMIISMRSCKRIMAIVNQLVTIMMERATRTRIWVEHNDPTKPHQSLKLQIAKTQVMTASGV